MRIRLAIPDELDDQDRKEALDAALESVTRSVAGMVRKRMVPPAAGMILNKRVRWQPEPPGDEHFDLPSTVIKRGHGDCDDLAPWHAGSLRAAGIDPHARAVVKKSGPTRWHALVVRGDGSIEDPSKHAGMGHSVAGAGGGVGPAIHKPMSADGRLCIALCPTRDPRHPMVWFARCDAPDSCEPWDWSTTAAHPDPKSALLKAIKTVRGVFGEDIDGEDDARLACLEDLINGCHPEDIAEGLDEELDDEDLDVDQVVEDALQSVGFLGDVISTVSKPFKSAAKAISPVAKFAAPFFAGSPMSGLAQGLASGDPMAMLTAMNPAARMANLQQGANVPAFMRAKEFFSKHPLGPTALPIAQTVLPTMFPGLGSMFMGLAAPGGGGGGMPQGIDPAQLMAMFGGGGGGMPSSAPTFKMEPGVLSQMFAGGGPSFMTF